MHLLEEDSAFQDHQEKLIELRKVALRFKKKDIDKDDVEHLFETPRKSTRQKRG